jgi:hypothetical protein
MFRLLVTIDVAPSLLILVSLMMGAICSSKTLVLTRATQCHIPKEGINNYTAAEVHAHNDNVFAFLVHTGKGPIVGLEIAAKGCCCTTCMGLLGPDNDALSLTMGSISFAAVVVSSLCKTELISNI